MQGILNKCKQIVFEVFLGEFDNPEIIWNTEMRRHLIERIALHVSDFTGRLTSNVKVR